MLGTKGSKIYNFSKVFILILISFSITSQLYGDWVTDFLDTNYENKVEAAFKSLKGNDFVYLHFEAIDECSHIGDIDLKIKAIEEFDKRLVSPILDRIDSDVIIGVLPDHPVPIKLRKHTRTPVPNS